MARYMRKTILLLFLFFAHGSFSECISDVEAFYADEKFMYAGTSPSIEKFGDLDGNDTSEIIVKMSGGKLGTGILYLKSSKGCYQKIYEGSAEVSILKEYPGAHQGAMISNFNGFKFISDRSVDGCSGGDRSHSTHAYSGGKYHLIKKVTIKCLSRLRH